jgi:hypothetical protein
MRFFDPEIVDADQLLGHPIDLLLLGFDLRFASADFVTQLGNAFLELAPLTFPPGAAHFELLAFAVDRLGDVRIIDSLHKLLEELTWSESSRSVPRTPRGRHSHPAPSLKSQDWHGPACRQAEQ